ncbi:ATP-binding protein [Streptomyces sp. NPDC048566]|uniref:ATP-binding protein n=1 Tax=Streptomyces sp. NPDC048566 TaxID=3365569 RepID=UPI003716880C
MARARRLTRARLSGWSVCEDTCDTAALVVSELVTNAIVHAAGRRVVCELRDGDDLVRIAVGDEGCAPGEPRPSPERPDEEHGRGLLLVAAVSRAWGALDTGPGLLVWAELARSAGRAHITGGAGAQSADVAPLGPDDLDRLEAALGAAAEPAAHGVPHTAGPEQFRPELGRPEPVRPGHDGPEHQRAEHLRSGRARAERGHSEHGRPPAGQVGAQPGRPQPEHVAQPDHVTRPHRAQPDRPGADRPWPHGGPGGTDTGPRGDLGWSAKKPPNDGRGTGAEGAGEAEGSWRTGTAGVRRDSSARGGDGHRERDGERRSR